VRNYLIEDFRPLDVRLDLGAMFENLIILGFLRKISYEKEYKKLYFFRNLYGSQKEIDLITEDIKGVKTGFEIKYQGGLTNKFPELGISRYHVISRENAPEFLV